MDPTSVSITVVHLMEVTKQMLVVMTLNPGLSFATISLVSENVLYTLHTLVKYSQDIIR